MIKPSQRYFLMAAILCSGLGCQPQTKQDRAGVGPEVAQNPSVDANPTASSDSLPSDSGPQGDGTQLNPQQWQESLKRMCEEGLPFACSQLAYDAQRAQRKDEAIGLLSRACLLDVPLSQCGKAATAERGLARACADLSPLYLQKGRSEEAQLFKQCACERNYQPACL
ncbi:MAG: hypothetical protein RIR26_2612 [Pseudomonadota bacterium]